MTTPPTRTVRIARKRIEAVDICSFELVDVDGGALPLFTAGSHIEVHLEGGLIRHYSLANDPRESHRYLIAVLRAPNSRGGSEAMHALREGQELCISGPRNHFALAPNARHHVLLAGGIGITPMLSMAERLSGAGVSFEMHYCARSAARMAFLSRIATSAYERHVHLHQDDGPIEQRLDVAAVVACAKPGTHLYVCGPNGFMEAVLASARAIGWPETALHREYFAGMAATSNDDPAFEVQIASTGRVIQVASGQSVVAALAAADIAVTVSCEQGVCGTCLTRVIAGTPEHRDMYLTDKERARGDQFTPCCSRAVSSRLVLDL